MMLRSAFAARQKREEKGQAARQPTKMSTVNRELGGDNGREADRSPSPTGEQQLAYSQ
jgi:hypothetical protein